MGREFAILPSHCDYSDVGVLFGFASLLGSA